MKNDNVATSVAWKSKYLGQLWHFFPVRKINDRRCLYGCIPTNRDWWNHPTNWLGTIHLFRQHKYFHSRIDKYLCILLKLNYLSDSYSTLFPYKPDTMPSFLGMLLGQESKIWTRSRKEKNNYNSTIFRAKKNKAKFFKRQTIRIFVVQWSFENLIFFSLTNQKKLAL